MTETHTCVLRLRSSVVVRIKTSAPDGCRGAILLNRVIELYAERENWQTRFYFVTQRVSEYNASENFPWKRKMPQALRPCGLSSKGFRDLITVFGLGGIFCRALGTLFWATQRSMFCKRVVFVILMACRTLHPGVPSFSVLARVAVRRPFV
jgi:hypothetical protein